MACDFQSFGMCLVYCGLQCSLVKVIICLKRSATLAGPEINKSFRLCRAGQFVHLGKGATFSFEIGCGHIDFRSEYFTPIDVTFEIQVGIGLDASCSTNSRCAAGEVELRESEWQLLKMCIAAVGGVSGIEHVLM